MGHAEDLVKLRTRMLDAVRAGVVDEDADTYRMTLIQILNEAESKRQKSEAGIANLRGQIKVMEGQVDAYSQVGSIVYAVLDGYVKISERAVAEEAAREKHRAEAAAEEVLLAPTLDQLAEHGYEIPSLSRDEMTASQKRADTRSRKKAQALYEEARG